MAVTTAETVSRVSAPPAPQAGIGPVLSSLLAGIRGAFRQAEALRNDCFDRSGG